MSEDVCAQVCDDVAASRVPSAAAAANSGTPEYDSRRNFGICIITVVLHLFSELQAASKILKVILPTFTKIHPSGLRGLLTLYQIRFGLR